MEDETPTKGSVNAATGDSKGTKGYLALFFAPFRMPNVRNHQNFYQEILAHYPFALDRQQRSYSTVREQHTPSVSCMKRRNSKFVDVLQFQGVSVRG